MFSRSNVISTNDGFPYCSTPCFYKHINVCVIQFQDPAISYLKALLFRLDLSALVMFQVFLRVLGLVIGHHADRAESSYLAGQLPLFLRELADTAARSWLC